MTTMTHEELVQQVEFKESNHSYTLEGKRIPSVTTILGSLHKGALVPWAAKLSSAHWLDEARKRIIDVVDGEGQLRACAAFDPDELEAVFAEAKKAHVVASRDGAYKGSLVHDAISRYHTAADGFDWEFEPPDDPEAAAAMEAFLGWYSRSTYEVLESERIVLDAKRRYVGTTDLVMVDSKGRYVVGDVKTNNTSKESPLGIYPEHLLQLAAYARAYEDETGNRVDRTVVIRCGKDGSMFPLERKRTAWQRDFAGFNHLLAVYECMRDLRVVVKG